MNIMHVDELDDGHYTTRGMKSRYRTRHGLGDTGGNGGGGGSFHSCRMDLLCRSRQRVDRVELVRGVFVLKVAQLNAIYHRHLVGLTSHMSMAT
jgi:hypothetical protein